jgi:hypothetical protein
MRRSDEENRKLHGRDIYAWSKATERLLLDHRIHEIDWDTVAFEIEKSGEANDANPMREAVEKLLTHLTIWQLRPDYQGPDRQAKIESARFKLDDILSRSPSLAGLIESEWRDLHARARFSAMLIMEEPAAATELETEAEAACGVIMRLSLGIATKSAGHNEDCDEDHYAWCRAQAIAARSRELDELDLIGIAEEIASVGASVRRSVIEASARLLEMLIAWQAGSRILRLRDRIASDRAHLRELLRGNASLAASPQLMTEAYKFAAKERPRRIVARESIGSQSCPWTLAQVLDDATISECEVKLFRAKRRS